MIQLSDSTLPVPPDGNQRDYLVSGQDVLAVVEELWLAGAEAVAVNGERVTVTTAIVDIGGSVLVNSAYIAPPYDVKAIGPAALYDTLVADPRVRGLHPQPLRDVRGRHLLRRSGRGGPRRLRGFGEPALRACGPDPSPVPVATVNPAVTP